MTTPSSSRAADRARELFDTLVRIDDATTPYNLSEQRVNVEAALASALAQVRAEAEEECAKLADALAEAFHVSALAANRAGLSGGVITAYSDKHGAAKEVAFAIRARSHTRDSAE